MQLNALKPYLLIAALGLCLFLPYLGNVHLFDWDEINFAEAAREMVVTGNYATVQIDFQPFWEKPPLFIWLQALSMNVFGIGEYAARLPNALVGVLTMLVLFGLHRRRGDETAGWWAALLFAGSYLSHFYSKSALIDPLFNLLMFLSLYKLSRFFDDGRYRHAVISGLVAGLAVLAKGPVAWLIVGGSALVYVIWKRAWHARLPAAFGLWLACSVAAGSAWFLFIADAHGGGLVHAFVRYQVRLLTTKDAGHAGFLLYHWVVLLVGMFPASVFFIAWFFSKRKPLRDHRTSFAALAVISFWVVLLMFTLVKTKIVHYSSFCYLPMCFVGGVYASRQAFRLPEMQGWLRAALLAGIAVVCVAVAALVIVGRNAASLIPYVNDSFAQGNLTALVEWPLWLLGLPLLLIAAAAMLLYSRSLLPWKRVAYLLAINAVWLELLMLLVVPRVEAHTQRAAIDFFKSRVGENADVIVYGYKSYAHLFYTQKQPTGYHPDAAHLINNPVLRTLYVVTRVDRAEPLKAVPDLEFLYGKDGFEFYRKKPL